MNKKSLKIIAVPMTVIVAKIITFVFDAILSSRYGAGMISDAFIMANSIPTILLDGVVAAMIACYIPIYEELKILDNKEYKNFSSNILMMSLILGLGITILFTSFRDGILGMYAKGFDDDSQKLLSYYVGILIWSIPFCTIGGVLRAYLQVNNSKAISNISQIIVYIVLICAVIITFPNDRLLPYAVVLGNAVSTMLLFCVSRAKNIRIKPYISFKASYLKKFFLMMFPVLISTLVGEINSLADKFFSSFFEAGIITSMTLSYKLSFAIQGIVSTSLMLILYPSLARSAAHNDTGGFSYHLLMSNKIIAWFSMPLVLGGIVMADDLIRIAFGHGKFTEENVMVTSILFTIYLLGVVPLCLKNISDKALYAMGKTNYTLWTSIISVVLNIGLNIMVYEKLKYIGLAAATSIAILAGTIIQWMIIGKTDEKLVSSQHFKVLIKPLLVSCLMAAGVLIFKNLLLQLQVGMLARTVLCCVVGAVLFAGLMLLTGKREIQEIISYLKMVA